MDEPGQMIVYADYVCPFCYLGKVSLERYQEGHSDAPEAVWRPFDLRGVQRRPDRTLDTSVADGKDEAYYERAKAGVRRLAEEFGAEMDVQVHREVDSYPAHLVALKIERTLDDGALAKWHDLVFDALWKEGQDIGDTQVLRGLADKIGVEPSVVDAALTDEVLKEELDRRFAAARQIGVTGVPTFVYGVHGVPGAVPPETIEALVAHVRKEHEEKAREG